jgi:site-specific DNA recombinase
MVAEYERARILDRSWCGRRHAARRGSVSLLTNAPYGYRYIAKHGDRLTREFQGILCPSTIAHTA